MKQLSDLETKEVSLVDKAANKKRFIVFKSKEAPIAKEDDQKLMAKVTKKVKEMVAKEDDGSGLSDRAQSALRAVARILAPFKDEITDAHLDAIQSEVGINAESEQPGEVGEEEIEMKKPDGVSDKDHADAMEEANKAYMAKLGKPLYPAKQPQQKSQKEMDEEESEKVAAKKAADAKAADEASKPKDKKEDDGVEKNNVTKSLDLSAFPEAQRPQLEAIFKHQNETIGGLVQKNVDLEKQLKDRDAKDLEKEFVSKADGLPNVGLAKADVIESLKDAHKAGPEAYARAVKNFETINKQNASSSLFKAIGSSGVGASGDAQGRLDALVESTVAKSSGKTKEEVYVEVLQSTEGQKLYAEAQAGRPGGI